MLLFGRPAACLYLRELLLLRSLCCHSGSSSSPSTRRVRTKSSQMASDTVASEPRPITVRVRPTTTFDSASAASNDGNREAGKLPDSNLQQASTSPDLIGS